MKEIRHLKTIKNKRNLNTKLLLLQNDQNADTTLLHSHDEVASVLSWGPGKSGYGWLQSAVYSLLAASLFTISPTLCSEEAYIDTICTKCQKDITFKLYKQNTWMLLSNKIFTKNLWKWTELCQVKWLGKHNQSNEARWGGVECGQNGHAYRG